MFRISVIAFFTLTILLLGSLRERQRFQTFLNRGSNPFRWKRRFPKASKHEIREFLDVFTQAFEFPENWRLGFSPEDRVMDIYRTRYPMRGEPDGMELEQLAGLLRARYSVGIVPSWREDVTLADLFTLTQGTPT